MLDVARDDLLDKAGVNLIQEQIKAIGSIESERNEISPRAELKIFQDLQAGGLDFFIGLLAPFILDALATGVVLGVIIS